MAAVAAAARRPRRARAELAVPAALLALAALLLVPGLDTLTGLHGDEAWVGLAARRVLAGTSRPVLGMTPYTGPWHIYMVAAVTALFGPEVTVLRGPGVACTLFAVAVYWLAIRRTLGTRTAGWSTALLVAWPTFTIWGRIAFEIFAVGPLWACLAAYAGIRAATGGSRRWAVGAGIAMALAAHTHLVLAALIPAALVTAAVTGHLRPRWLAPAALAAGLAYAYPAWRMVLARGRMADAAGRALGTLGERLAAAPALALEALHGDMVFLQHVGRVVAPGFPWAAAAALLALGVLLAHAAARPRGAPAAVLAGCLTLWGVTALLVPQPAARHLVLPLWAIPVAVALAAECLITAQEVWRRPATLVLAGLVAVQLARTATNFTVPLRREGARAADLWVGGALETSVHFVDQRALLAELDAVGARTVVAEELLAWSLSYYQATGAYGGERLEIVPWRHDGPDAATFAPGTTFATFRDPAAAHTAAPPAAVVLRETPTVSIARRVAPP